jgi:hypothetical protein
LNIVLSSRIEPSGLGIFEIPFARKFARSEVKENARGKFDQNDVREQRSEREAYERIEDPAFLGQTADNTESFGRRQIPPIGPFRMMRQNF